MSRLEIKYLAHATGKGAAAAEHLSALEPACKDHIIGLRNIENSPYISSVGISMQLSMP